MGKVGGGGGGVGGGDSDASTLDASGKLRTHTRHDRRPQTRDLDIFHPRQAPVTRAPEPGFRSGLGPGMPVRPIESLSVQYSTVSISSIADRTTRENSRE